MNEGWRQTEREDEKRDEETGWLLDASNDFVLSASVQLSVRRRWNPTGIELTDESGGALSILIRQLN
jgi:hypothetical protein